MMTRALDFRTGLAVSIVIALGAAAAWPIGLPAVAAEPVSLPSPLDVLADCAKAVEGGDFARYVNHLSEREQKHQAGYALFTSSMTLQAVATGNAEIEPETLLFLRAVTDLIEQQRAGSDAANAKHQALLTPAAPPAAYPVYSPSVASVTPYAPTGAASAVQAGQVFREAADTLKDPRAFLIGVLTEFSRPVEITGSENSVASSEPPLAEFVRAFKQQEVTVYARGDYAVAVPKKSSKPTAAEAPSEAPLAIQESAAHTSPWPVRIEFRRVDGQWKITHLLPLAELDPTVAVSAIAAYAYPQPVSAPATAVYAPAYAPAAPASPPKSAAVPK